MFTLYHSNQLDVLKSLMITLMQRTPLESVFAPEIVLVQSKGMSQWLRLEIAKECGIAANIDFQLPGRFIWSLISQISSNAQQENVFTRDMMRWKLLIILPTLHDHPAFKQLTTYFNDDNSVLKQFQFADKMAGLFEHYLMYREDWIARWSVGEIGEECDESQKWQAILWKALLDYTVSIGELPTHRANLYQQLLTQLKSGAFPKTLLPKRLFIIGINALPPIYLTLLHALGEFCDVHLMLTNPCRWFWGDIQDPHWLAKLALTSRTHYQSENAISVVKTLEKPLTHPLLASWGKQGRDTLYLLQDLDPKFEIDAFVDITPDNLLSYIQHTILELDGEISEKPYEIAINDESVQCHICHSRLREVEVLHDHILSLLDHDNTLKPSDIIVMMPDIDAYTPYIQAVFGQADPVYLPFSISDRKVKECDPIIQTFLSLIDLPSQRYTTDELFKLLEQPAISHKFNLDQTRLNTVKNWIIETGIRWGLNDQHIRELELPEIGQNSWEFGLWRMLLGYSMQSEQGDWNAVLPFDETRGLVAELVGHLSEFVHRLMHWQKQLRAVQTLDEWQPLIVQLIQDFFVITPETEASLLFIENTWQTVIKDGKSAHFDAPLAFEQLHMMLQTALEDNVMELNFLSGKINFCTFMPMRSIPFKIVCLLGMNDGEYPRVNIHLDFDLMAKHPRRGDRTRREDDRYLFLEALLAAQNQLYLSYIGFSIQDNTPRFPSLLITELLEFIKSRAVHQQGAIESALLTTHSRVPFDQAHFLPQNPRKSYAKKWLPAAHATRKTRDLAPIYLPETPIKTVQLHELKQFYRHSYRYFFQKRLHVDFSLPEQILRDDEPFALKGLSRYQLHNRLLQHRIHGESAEAFWHQQRLAGELPIGRFGDHVINACNDEIEPLYARIATRLETDVEPLDVNMKIGEFDLQGHIMQSQSNGLLHWRAGELSIYDGFRLWIDHVILCALSSQKPALMLGLKHTAWYFSPVECNVAKAQLRLLLQGYRSGLQTPLLLPLKSAWSWMLTVHSDKAEQADEKLQQDWEKERDAYYARLNIDTLPLNIVHDNATQFLSVLFAHHEKLTE